MSPGRSGAICVMVTGGAGVAGAGVTGAGVTGAGVTGAAGGASTSFWYSQKLMVWGTLSSVTVKSLAVRPSMGLPFLSVTVTVSITSCCVTENLTGPLAGAGVC